LTDINLGNFINSLDYEKHLEVDPGALYVYLRYLPEQQNNMKQLFKNGEYFDLYKDQ
jgi:hypothetical protein